MSVFDLRKISEYGKFIVGASFEEKYYPRTKSKCLGMSLKQLGTELDWYSDNAWAKKINLKSTKIEEETKTDSEVEKIYKSIDDIVYLPKLTEEGFVFEKKQLKIFPQLVAYDTEKCMHVYNKEKGEWIKVKSKYKDEFSNFLLLLLCLYAEK